MKVAVTGATGFCGGAVVRALQAHGHAVVAVGRRPFDDPTVPFVAWHAPEPFSVNAEAVIHLAAHVDDRGAFETFRRVNVDGTAAVLASGIPCVSVSTASVYAPVGRAVDECAPLAPDRSHYARSKAIADQLALQAGAVVLRPRAVYGPGDPYLQPRLLAAVRAGRLFVPGPSRPASLTHVDTLADACVRGLDLAPGAYNVADPEPYDRDDALRMLLDRLRPGTRITPIPVGAAYAIAELGRWNPQRRVTRYAIDQLARPTVLDTGKLRGTGFIAERRLEDYLRDAVLND